MRLGTFQADLKGDEIKRNLAFKLKALGYSDDKIEMITLTPMGFTLVMHVDDLVNKGKLTEEEANKVLALYNSAVVEYDLPDKYGFPEDDLNLPDSNGNMTTVTNKNYWWLYLALGVGLGLMFKKKK